MLDPKVSVIIPVYDVSSYLEKCLNSIVNQTLKEIEIILVNDCSPDPNDDVICRTFAEKDSRVVYIKLKENSGVGGARNAGIKVAKADYICFVDSDDYMKLDALETTHKIADEKDIDIIVFGHNYVRKDGKVISKNRCKGDTEGDLLDNFLNYRNTMQPSMWGKLWKRSLFLDHHIEFPKKMVFEDIIIMPMILNYTKKILFLENIYYNYVKREGSITQTFSKKHIDDIFNARIILRNFFSSVNKLDKYSVSLERVFWRMLQYHIDSGFISAKHTVKKEMFSYLFDKISNEKLENTHYYFPHRCY